MVHLYSPISPAVATVAAITAAVTTTAAVAYTAAVTTAATVTGINTARQVCATLQRQVHIVLGCMTTNPALNGNVSLAGAGWNDQVDLIKAGA
jgi:hypothetical protein